MCMIRWVGGWVGYLYRWPSLSTQIGSKRVMPGYFFPSRVVFYRGRKRKSRMRRRRG